MTPAIVVAPTARSRRSLRGRVTYEMPLCNRSDVTGVAGQIVRARGPLVERSGVDLSHGVCGARDRYRDLWPFRVGRRPPIVGPSAVKPSRWHDQFPM